MEEIKNIDELFSDNSILNFRDRLINDSIINENIRNKLKQVDANGMRWLLFLYLIGPKQTFELLSNQSTADFLISQIYGSCCNMKYDS